MECAAFVSYVRTALESRPDRDFGTRSDGSGDPSPHGKPKAAASCRTPDSRVN